MADLRFFSITRPANNTIRVRHLQLSRFLERLLLAYTSFCCTSLWNVSPVCATTYSSTYLFLNLYRRSKIPSRRTGVFRVSRIKGQCPFYLVKFNEINCKSQSFNKLKPIIFCNTGTIFALRISYITRVQLNLKGTNDRFFNDDLHDVM